MPFQFFWSSRMLQGTGVLSASCASQVIRQPVCVGETADFDVLIRLFNQGPGQLVADGIGCDQPIHQRRTLDLFHDQPGHLKRTLAVAPQDDGTVRIDFLDKVAERRTHVLKANVHDPVYLFLLVNP